MSSRTFFIHDDDFFVEVLCKVKRLLCSRKYRCFYLTLSCTYNSSIEKDIRSILRGLWKSVWLSDAKSGSFIAPEFHHAILYCYHAPSFNVGGYSVTDSGNFVIWPLQWSNCELTTTRAIGGPERSRGHRDVIGSSGRARPIHQVPITWGHKGTRRPFSWTGQAPGRVIAESDLTVLRGFLTPWPRWCKRLRVSSGKSLCSDKETISWVVIQRRWRSEVYLGEGPMSHRNSLQHGSK